MMSIGGSTSVDNFSSGNFWEVKEYQRCLHRLENAYKLCTELCHLLHERAEVERTYSNNLQKWSSKWSQFMDSSSEYGGSRIAWQALCTEANEVASLHKEIRDVLVDEIIADLKKWRKERFHKSTLPPMYIKEVKHVEQAFDTAQKPWAKRYRTCQQCRKDYHTACKMNATCQSQVQTAKSDVSTTAEQLQKLEDKLHKAEREQTRTKECYEKALQDLESDEQRYMDEMASVFNLTQVKEKERIDFLKEIYLRIHAALDISQNIKLPQIYSSLKANMACVNSAEDINWWSENYGVDMPLQCVQFEEYRPDSTGTSSLQTEKVRYYRPRTITAEIPSSPKRRAPSLPSASGISVDKDSPKFHQITKTGDTIKNDLPGNPEEYDESLNPFAELMPQEEILIARVTTSEENQVANESPSSINPFEEEIQEIPSTSTDNVVANEEVTHYESADALQESQHQSTSLSTTATITTTTTATTTTIQLPGFGRKIVRALYDYTASEDDELSFKAGDVFEELDDGDSQGWSEGIKDGRRGLYPHSYVVAV